MIRLIIAGPRDYYDRENVFCHIHMFQGKFGIDEIVSGGASGVDKLAEEYAFCTRSHSSFSKQIGKNTEKLLDQYGTGKWQNTLMPC